MADLLDRVISGVRPDVRPSSPRVRQQVAGGEESRLSEVGMNAGLNAPGDVTAEQVILGGVVQGARQSLVVQARDPLYYFELRVLERRGSGESDEVAPVRGALSQGQTYLVRATLNENATGGTSLRPGEDFELVQEQKKLSGEVSISLEVKEDDGTVVPPVKIGNQGGRLSPREKGGAHDFELTVVNAYPATVTLQLLFQLSGTQHQPQRASTLTIRLQGNANIPPPQISKILRLAADAEPPDGAAILHVSRLDENRLRLVGWTGKRVNSSLNLDSQSFTLPDPQEYPTGEAYVRAISKQVHEFSGGEVGAVADWFEKVLKLYREDSCIIIVDQSGTQVPWEMFRLEGGTFLGARALVVRWAEAQYRNQPIMMPSGELKFEGRVCSFIHPVDAELLANTSAEFKKLISNYNTTPEELERELYCCAEHDPVGLVYLCYGGILLYGDEGRALENLGFPAPYDESVQVRLDLAVDKLNPRPIFFANAPYTGRLLVSERHLYGLAKALLTQLAASYIGLLAPIDRRYAEQFAQELLAAALSEEGVKLAELLRKSRAEAVARLSDPKLTKEEWARARLELIYPFMYVHYGNPHDWLKLTAPPQAAAEEDDRV